MWPTPLPNPCLFRGDGLYSIDIASGWLNFQVIGDTPVPRLQILKMLSERIPAACCAALERDSRANFKMAKIPYSWKIPCSSLQDSSNRESVSMVFGFQPRLLWHP
jgi:hypothetical protein